MSHYVFVESNTTGTGRLAIEQLLADGELVSFVTARADRYPFLPTAHPRLRVVACDTDDAPALEACVRALGERAPLDAVLTFSTFYVAPVADVARRLGLPTIDPAAARRCHHKDQCRVRLRERGLPAAGFRVVADAAGAEVAAAEVRYPCVVKPVAESGSSGVRQVADRGELLAHHAALTERTTNERGQPLPREVLIEDLLVGPEYSVETIAFAGEVHVVGITAKRVSAPPWFVELGHVFPAPLDAATHAALAGAALAGLAAVGASHGPAHTEVKLTAEGPVIVEINPRLAGGMIPELVRHALGVDLLRATLAAALGRAPELAPTRREVAAIRFLIAPRAGRLHAVHGVARARQVPAIREVRIDKSIGSLVAPARTALDRIGFAIAAGPDRAAVERDLDAAVAAIELEVHDR